MHWTRDSLALSQTVQMTEPQCPTATDKHSINKSVCLLKIVSMLDKNSAIQHWHVTPQKLPNLCCSYKYWLWKHSEKVLLFLRDFFPNPTKHNEAMLHQSTKHTLVAICLHFLYCSPIVGKPPQTPVVPCGRDQTHWSSSPYTCYMHP